MKKMKLTRSLLAACSIVALSAVMYGCVHNGDDDAPMMGDMDMMETMPAPTPVAVTLPSASNMYLADSDTMLADGMITLTAGGSSTVGAYTFSCSAAGPCAITIANGAVMATGVVTAAYSTAAMATIADGKRDGMTESDGRAAGLHEALTRSGGANDIFIGGPSGAPLTVTPVQIPEAGFVPGTVTDIVITRGLTGDLMVTRDRATWHAPATAAAAAGETGWAGKVLTNGATQTITVYSNIANAVRADFEADVASSIYRPGLNSGGITHLQGASTDGTLDIGPLGPTGLTLTAADMQDAAAQGLLDPSYFPGPGATGSRTVTYTYSDNTPTPGPTNYAASFTGTFHGASGTYACATDPCTIAVTPANLTAPATYAANNDWTFLPDREAADSNDAQLHMQDSNWLSFGWWVNEPAAAAPGGAYLYNAQVFYGGADQFAAANLAAGVLNRLNLTYTGPAGGLYARTANETTGVTAARGEFTADASLTARYGVTAGTDVSGTIDNFANGGGVDMSGWKLNLAQTAVAATTSGATGANAGSVTSGDSTNRAGRWEYTLYGPSRAQEYPSGIAGRFFANVDANTAVAGSFGAE